MNSNKHTYLNIAAYRFVAIDDPDQLVTAIRTRCLDLNLKGSVLVAGEGINVFLAGLPDAVRDFLGWLAADARFAGIDVKFSESAALPFNRLMVKHKREIITFRQPQISPAQAPAPAVDAETLCRWLDQGHDDTGRDVVLVDTRNAQEVELGFSRDTCKNAPQT